MVRKTLFGATITIAIHRFGNMTLDSPMSWRPKTACEMIILKILEAIADRYVDTCKTWIQILDLRFCDFLIFPGPEHVDFLDLETGCLDPEFLTRT